MELFEIDYKIPNGKMIRLRIGFTDKRVDKININGDFFIHPEERLSELENELIGTKLDEAELSDKVESILSKCELIGISPCDIVKALIDAKNHEGS